MWVTLNIVSYFICLIGCSSLAAVWQNDIWHESSHWIQWGKEIWMRKCNWMKITPIDIHHCLLSIYRNHAADVSTIKRWVMCFSSGISDFSDKPHSTHAIKSVLICSSVQIGPMKDALCRHFLTTMQILLLWKSGLCLLM